MIESVQIAHQPYHTQPRGRRRLRNIDGSVHIFGPGLPVPAEHEDGNGRVLLLDRVRQRSSAFFRNRMANHYQLDLVIGHEGQGFGLVSRLPGDVSRFLKNESPGALQGSIVADAEDGLRAFRHGSPWIVKEVGPALRDPSPRSVQPHTRAGVSGRLPRMEGLVGEIPVK